ncbi:AI-2E family transporter [Oscillatoria acuminata]|uniref:Putative permease n=1 Tax=Oscillatoria acuminata PCC 6304 TaxID=56110 RepID=K9TRN8_9CYAN|nr:AI-2E family transporter [Oscillatoria acuminata]AFY85078.1 putative permease [Oscillatoria acuminata PCC 6304]
MSPSRIKISLTTLLLIFTLGLLVILLWQLRSLLITLMVSVVLAASISPVVNWAEKWHIPRWIATIITYLTLIGGLTGVVLLIGPTALDQIQRLIRQLPSYLETLRLIAEDLAARLIDTPPEFVRQFFDTQSVTTWGIRSTQQLVLRSYGLTRGLLGGVVTLILSIFISGYMVADSHSLIKSLVQLFPKPWDERLETQVMPISQRMGGYIRGRVLVSALLAVATSVGLSALGLGEFALGLGAIAGVTNLIPFLGPILGAVPALIVAVSQGGWLFLSVLILFVVIQNVETYVLDPLLVGSSVGVHPLYQLLSVIGGVQVLGIVGALIVPPWVAGGAALVENLYLKPKLRAEAVGTPEAIGPTSTAEESSLAQHQTS